MSSAVKSKSSPDSLRSTTWPPEMNQMLMDASKKKLTWDQISVQVFHGKRSATACRKRYARMRDSQQANELGRSRLDDLGSAYQDVRKEMWSILGSRVNISWEAVEEECMGQGTNNLRRAAHSARRRSGNYSSDSGSATSATFDPNYFYEQPRPAFRPHTIQSMLAPQYPESQYLYPPRSYPTEDRYTTEARRPSHRL